MESSTSSLSFGTEGCIFVYNDHILVWYINMLLVTSNLKFYRGGVLKQEQPLRNVRLTRENDDFFAEV